MIILYHTFLRCHYSHQFATQVGYLRMLKTILWMDGWMGGWNRYRCRQVDTDLKAANILMIILIWSKYSASQLNDSLSMISKHKSQLFLMHKSEVST
jgi:hypothetical protein